MNAPLHPLRPEEARARLEQGKAVLVDIREPDEFARLHVVGAFSKPLSRWDAAELSAHADKDVIFTCRSGMRTAGACDLLAARVDGPAYVLEGGLAGWVKAGLPVIEDKAAPMEMMRQVQIAAGMLVLLGTLLGLFVGHAYFALPAFVGAGLTFAGATGYCGMARLLAHAPWNRAMKTA